jgi:hypothetical protein
MLSVALKWELADRKEDVMTALAWNQPGQKIFETGLDRGVLYPRLGPGVAWNGLVAVDENPSGGEPTPLYFDGQKYLDVMANEDFQATLQAMAAPPEFAACDGQVVLAAGLVATQQPRDTFGLSYRTLVGNDTQGTDHGYKLHLVYNATAGPAPKSHRTTSNASDLSPTVWTIYSVPVPATTYRPSGHLVLDSRDISPSVLQEIEDLLYGTVSTAPELPTPAELIVLLS